jgi:cardiolipin synthase
VNPPQFSFGHELGLLQGGGEFFAELVAAIDISQHEVRLETYIFHFDVSGENVAAALVRAAQRGVAVYLVMDGIGTPAIPPLWTDRFALAHVQWHRFSPLGFAGLLSPARWRRMHRKLCVVDAHIGFCGGINILDDLCDPEWGTLDTPRFDFSVRVQGPLVRDMHRAMAQFWDRLQVTQQLERLQFERARQIWRQPARALPPSQSGAGNGAGTPVGAEAALVLRDNVQNRTRIERSYRKAIGDARSEVLIANAYFLPGRKLRRALTHAVKRGVRVTLLLQGRYDNFMQFHASRPIFGALLESGVEIVEYSTGFLHAKVAVIDGRWATVGSSNLDPLSLLLAREANLVVQDETFAQQLHQCLTAAMQTQGVRLEANTFSSRPLRHRFLDWLAYGLMRSLLFLTGTRY